MEPITSKKAGKMLTRAIRSGAINFTEAECIMTRAFISGTGHTPGVGQYDKTKIREMLIAGVEPL